jgi:hypothetical protein
MGAGGVKNRAYSLKGNGLFVFATDDLGLTLCDEEFTLCPMRFALRGMLTMDSGTIERWRGSGGFNIQKISGRIQIPRGFEYIKFDVD